MTFLRNPGRLDSTSIERRHLAGNIGVTPAPQVTP